MLWPSGTTVLAKRRPLRRGSTLPFGIYAQVTALSETQGKPAGVVRISAPEHVADTVLWPKLIKLLPDYPDIRVEITVEYGLIDIVADRYDTGVRLGH